MQRKIVLISILAILMIAVSGCLSNDDNPVSKEGVADMVVVNNTPAGFEYLGSPSMSVEYVKQNYGDVSGIVEAAEGIYQNDQTTEVHITAVEMESTSDAQNLIDQYKSQFKQLKNGDRFTDDSFNGHTATRILTSYAIVAGEQVPRYEYIWNNQSYVYIVNGNTNDYTVLRQFAEATGY